MRLLLLNVLVLLAAFIYVIDARRSNNHLSSNNAITTKKLTALYKVASPKEVVQEMVKCNVTFFPLERYQKSFRLRRKIRKFYRRYIRKWRKQQNKLKKLKKLKSIIRDRSVDTANQTMQSIIASNTGMNQFLN